MNKKRLFAAILSAAMMISLAACGGGGNTSTPSTGGSSTSQPAGSTSQPAGGDGEKMFIPVISKGFQHQFWQTAKAGADAAAADFNVDIYFDGPASETDIDDQVNMIKDQLAKNPAAIALAALSTDAVKEILEECASKNIPVIGFDSGVPDDTSGAVKATACTNNEAAAVMVAEKFDENADLVAKMKAATPDAPVIIGCLAQDAVSASITQRTTGFVKKMTEVAEKYQPGKVSVEGHTKWEKKVADPAIIIRIEVSATSEATAVQTAANSLLGTKGLAAVFCSNEGAVTGFLAAVSDGEDLAEGGRYADIVVAGFDAGAAQKNAVRNGWFYGSVTQDPYQIGYKAVEMAAKAAKGEAVSDVDTGAQWYNADNIDDEMISMLVYD